MQTTLAQAEQRACSRPARSTNTSTPAPATLPDLSAAARASSTTSPPRAQLMMRTPSFILAIAAASMMFLRLLGQRRVQRDEIGAAEELVELDLLDAELACARSSDRNGSKAITFILRPMRAVGDDRADIAAADDAERLAGDLDAHEAVLLPLAGLGRGVGGGELAGHARTSCAMACSAVVIELPKGVFITMMPRWRRRRHVDIVDADAGAADDAELASPRRSASRVTLVAERMARPS